MYGNGLRRTSREVWPASRLAVLVAASGVAAFLALAVLLPMLDARGAFGASGLSVIFAPLCHRIPSRSLILFETPMALCARCAGLYAGGWAGLVAALGGCITGRRSLAWIALAVLPTSVDVLAAWVGLPTLSNVPRLVAALPAGFVGGLLLAEGIVDFVRSRSGLAAVAQERAAAGPM